METEEKKKTTKAMGSPSEMEQSITRAMRGRVGHFKDQADSLTLEGVRRLLEKDLGMETFALDVHKRFIKQCLQECFEKGGDENTSKTSKEAVKEVVSSTKEKKSDLAEVAKPPKEAKENYSKDDEKKEGSPVLGLLEEEEEEDGAAEDGTDGTNESQTEKAPSEVMIKKAVKKRASYFRTNSHKVTMVDARRLLEDDLKLAKNALDPFKTFIREQVDQILESIGDEEPVNEVKKKKSGKKASESDNEEQSSQYLNGEDEEEEEEMKPKKKVAPKRKIKSSEQPTNRKRSSVETKTSSKKQRKTVEQEEEKSSDSKDGGNLSEDGQSQSSVEEPVKKKKEASNLAYGKHVEHLKSVIKSCGMSVPPSIYKRVKQAQESKRETYLIKELEDILKREGLSTNPSEKDIKAVKKRKERTKELEGIDLSNIVSTSRRRSSSFSSITPPKPQTPVESDEEESEEDESNDEGDDDAGHTDGNNSEGASEESNEGESL
ncbi:hypothetical protein Sjap_021525 [Stephania japonica]|uniref:Histone chaperone domain-containing protein n=1 Tax=Stephania japonica TaxID=461633 RepID=A0AAP0HP36_9MAGN